MNFKSERGGNMQTKRGMNSWRLWLVAAVVAAFTSTGSPGSALASSASEINAKVNTALAKLYKTEPGAQTLANKARGVLVFPDIVKGGFVVAGQYGDGALRKAGKTVAFYRSLAASVGFQAGVESFSYALMFMDNDSLSWLDKSDGWEIGTGPTITVLDMGFSKNFSSTTLQKGVYAFIYGQKGLMGGISLQGTKITKIDPDK
jgi:lipid-binding SYLF domain-containing protein